MANSPLDGQILIALRIRETAFKAALKAAPLGTKFQVSRPRGSFTLHEDATRPAVFLAGGIGITPMRSILHWAAQERLPHKLYLFYSNRHLEDTAFLEELEDLATQNPCRRQIIVKSDFDSNGIRAEAGLEGSGSTARAQTKVGPFMGTSEHLSCAVGTVGIEEPRDSVSEAVRLAQEGDAAAFEFIYRLYCRRVYALCLRMVKDTNEAEDLTQEAFMQVFRKIHTFRGEAAFSSWLHRLTANIVIMRLRRKRLTSTSLDQAVVGDDDGDRSHNEPGTPDLRMTGLFDRCNLQRAVNQLPQGYKATFILHDVQGYRHKQIARILGCSVGTCKSQLYRARKGIRKFLQSLQHYGSGTDRGRANRTLAPVSR